MKLTKSLVKMFEDDQKHHGTETAIYNIIWQIASELLNGIGVMQIKTSNKEKK